MSKENQIKIKACVEALHQVEEWFENNEIHTENCASRFNDEPVGSSCDCHSIHISLVINKVREILEGKEPEEYRFDEKYFKTLEELKKLKTVKSKMKYITEKKKEND